VIVIAALLLIGVSAIVVVIMSSSEPSVNVTPPTTTTCSSGSVPVPTSSAVPTTTSVPTSTTTTATSVPAPLAPGATGPAVVALQTRLRELGYWLGDDTGEYGDATLHAVIAFQKARSLSRDGVVGPETRGALATAARLTPRSASGHVIEIDLGRQLLLDVTDGRVVWVFDTSTGARAGTTPTGQFRVQREIDANVHAPLGVLYRPKYFYGGVAIHGNPSVPAYPASHGCVRVINEAMDWLWEHDALAISTPVWVY
jgi:lipoprotein-anchoring transpeptidase ErfK/SrfK